MEKIAYIIIYIFTELLSYTLTYVVIFSAVLTKQKKRMALAVGILMMFHFFVLVSFGEEDVYAVTFFSMLVIPLILLEPFKIRNLVLYPVVMIGTSVIGVSVSFLLAVLLGIPEYVITETAWLTLLCQYVQVIALVTIAVYRKKKKVEFYENDLDFKQYLVFYVVIICLFFMLASLQELTTGESSEELINLFGVMVSVSCIVLVAITTWQGITAKREAQLKVQNQMGEKYLELQKQYYAEMLEQDEKMRRFRHDMKAHFIALQAYCEQGANSDMSNYLNEIVKASAIKDLQTYTGNRGIDAIIRKLHDEALRHEISLEVEGNLDNSTRINEYDLCAIIYNLLSNAIEAGEKIEEVSLRKIVMSVGMYNSQIYIRVKNKVAEDVVIQNNRLITSKKDKKYHGIGSQNIESIVKKYQGIVRYTCKDSWFSAEVDL